jgi:hypothetical protein
MRFERGKPNLALRLHDELALLWRTTLRLWARVCSLLGSCVALCQLTQLLRCRLCLVLLGVAPSQSVTPGVLRPKPRWGRAWSPICSLFVFFFINHFRTQAAFAW